MDGAAPHRAHSAHFTFFRLPSSHPPPFSSTPHLLLLLLSAAASPILSTHPEIKADRKGVHEYRTELRKLEIERDDIEARDTKNAALAKTFDEQFGPFMVREK